MMPALIASSSPCRSAATFDSKSWNGAMPTPSFSSVPTYGSFEKLPAAASDTTAEVADLMPLRIEVSVMSQTLGSVSQKSASTPISAISRPESRMAAAAHW